MQARTRALIVAGILGCAARPAHADPRGDIAARARAAMASYDSMDYEQARKLLYQALAIAKKARLDKDPIVARVYLDLGIAQLAGSDQEAAKLALLSAAQIDPKIAIEAGYKSPELVKLLDDAKATAAAIESGDAGADDCRTNRDIRYTIVDVGRRGAAQAIEATIGGEVPPARVVVMYRPEGALDFVEVRLTRQGGCRYTGSIPASATRGSLVHYYVAAYDASNKVLAAKGSSRTPNVLELRGAGRAGESGLAPVAAAEAANDPAAEVPGDKLARPPGAPRSAAPKILLAVSGGTGFGYVSGKTENGNQVQSCCIGSSLLVLTPEIGYHVTPRLTLGVAARLGFPIGADIAGHSSIAPAGFVRARYAVFQSSVEHIGDGLHVMAEVGGGILRNTIKLSDDVTMSTGPGMDTDIVAQGPLLVGAGAGYRHHLGDRLAVLVELDAMAGIAVTRTFGSAVHLNSGVSADLSLGLALGF
jgi:hypothetical protein